MNYKAKTLELQAVIDSLGTGHYPLTNELKGKIRADTVTYWVRIGLALISKGKVKLDFEDLKYYPKIRA